MLTPLRSHALKLAALLLLAWAYLVLPAHLPARVRVESHWGDEGVNWFGQGQAAAYCFALAVLALLCSLRLLIVRWAVGPADALAWYGLLVAALLPAVWLLVVFDWDNEAASPEANWVGTPIALLFVPSVVACWDVLTGTRLSGWNYAARSLLEVVVLVPLWVCFWVMCMELPLGWVGP
jgi:hypothetical protein